VFIYLAVFAALFLVFCVYQNRRSGYQRDRPAVSLLEEGLIWIKSIEATLWEEAATTPGPVQNRLSTAETPSTSQLVNLSTALGASSAPVLDKPPVEAQEAIRTSK
jgi:hypothetical protein